MFIKSLAALMESLEISTNCYLRLFSRTTLLLASHIWGRRSVTNFQSQLRSSPSHSEKNFLRNGYGHISVKYEAHTPLPRRNVSFLWIQMSFFGSLSEKSNSPRSLFPCSLLLARHYFLSAISAPTQP